LVGHWISYVSICRSDSFGSNDAPADFFDPFIATGGRFATFSPRFSTSYFVRNHQKMIIADDVSAVIGGFNIADRYFDSHENDAQQPENPTSWEDLGLLIHGPEVARLSDYFDQLSDWVNHQNGNIRALRKIVKNWPADEGPFQWLLGGPSNRLSRWAWSIKNDLEDGQRLDLISAYFSPGLGLRRRMARISNRNGQGRLILPGKTDNAATIGASRSLYGYLLKRKTKIYEYQPKRLHMKMVIIDNITYIGSANFDLRSLYINVEMMLRIEDEVFADQARSIAENLMVSSEPITWDLHRSRRSFLNRMRWAISYFVVNKIGRAHV